MAAGGGDGRAAFERPEALAFIDRVMAAPATEAAGVALRTKLHFGDDDVTGEALVLVEAAQRHKPNDWDPHEERPCYRFEDEAPQ